ncbi:MAG TPA: photosynthetic reaction center subunit H [Beijerinckiaceae bacterium]|jgi:photosynthetic reaction center H subunit
MLGAITSNIDVAQVTLYVFFGFFISLVWYLRQEDKREGYPLDRDRPGSVLVQGLPPMPPPKSFLLREGHTYQAPPGNTENKPINAMATSSSPGSPLEPMGDPMHDAIGPAAYADRDERPEHTAEGDVMIVPLRVAADFYVEPRDPDPRGMPVYAADGVVAGTVRELWIDRSEVTIRYLEVAVEGRDRPALLPMTLARIHGKHGYVNAESVTARQFATAPATAKPDEITLREEDRIMAYFGSGHLFAVPERREPAL